jgi:hypothetical protein
MIHQSYESFFLIEDEDDPSMLLAKRSNMRAII